MSNMSYCRFENTLNDLGECLDNLEDKLEEGSHEHKARKELIKTCFAICKDFIEVSNDSFHVTLDMDAINSLPIERD